MKKTYTVTTYDGKTSYTVTLDETGVVEADLPATAFEDLKASVSRSMSRYGLSAITALGRVVGSYSVVTDEAQAPEVS